MRSMFSVIRDVSCTICIYHILTIINFQYSTDQMNRISIPTEYLDYILGARAFCFKLANFLYLRLGRVVIVEA